MPYANDPKSNTLAQIEDCKEDVNTVEDKHIASGDYSGAAAKIDEREIALVRKLDIRIMPTLFCMYFLNYLVSRLLCNPHC